MNAFMRIGFNSTIELVPLDEGQVVSFNGEFVCDFRNGDCMTGSRGDYSVGCPHGFIIHRIKIFSKKYKKVKEMIDIKNRWVDYSWVFWSYVPSFDWDSPVSSTKSTIKSSFRKKTFDCRKCSALSTTKATESERNDFFLFGK
ncbi:hypothetical protein Tco_0400362 [Tanacetum coccineum]